MKVTNRLFENAQKNSTVWAHWLWNGKITENELEQQLDKLLNIGFSGVAIRPAPDMLPNLLSEEFKVLFSSLLANAKKRDLKVMFSDNLGAPVKSEFYSALEQTSNFKAKRLQLIKYEDIEGGSHYTTKSNSYSQRYIVAVQLINKKITLNGIKTVYEGKKPFDINFKAPKGFWRVMEFEVREENNRDGSPIVNFFSSKVAQLYISSVLEPLKDLIGKDYKNIFEGYICEVPAITPSSAGIPWDDEKLIAKYKARFKKNLIETIPALFAPLNDNEVKFRAHIYNFLGDTLNEKFLDTTQKWCNKNGNKLWITAPDTDRNGQTTALSSIYIPMLPKYAEYIGTSNSSQSVVSSILNRLCFTTSRVNGSKKISFIGRNNQMRSNSINEIKEQINREIAVGTDKVIIDGIRFNRSYHYNEISPQGISFGHPDFPYLKEVITSAKTELEISRYRVEEKYKVAILFPNNSIFADYRFSKQNSVEEVASKIKGAIDNLNRKEIPFDIISESILLDCKITADGNIEDKNTGIEYSSIIIPSSRIINNSIFVFIEKWAIKKGQIIFLDSAPEASFDEGGSSLFTTRVEKLISSKTKNVFVEHTTNLSDRIYPLFKSIKHNINTITDDSNVEILEYEIESVKGFSIYNHNSNRAKLSLTRVDNHKFYSFNTKTGKVEKIETNDGRDRPLEIIMPKNETLNIITTGDNVGTIKKSFVELEEYSFKIKFKPEKWLFSTESLNNFPLSRWSSRVGINKTKGTLTYYLESSFQSEIVAEEAYLIFFDKSCSKDDLKGRFKLTVNGKELSPIEKRVKSKDDENYIESFFDETETLLIYDISEVVIKGHNRVLVLTNGDNAVPNPITFPPFISINAPVKQDISGWSVISNEKNQSFQWGGTGYPFLIGTGEYTSFFESPSSYNRVILNIEKASGSVSVFINNRELTSIIWAPYRFDITEYLVEKRNDITIKINNTLDAISTLNGTKSGLLGEVSLEVYGGDNIFGEEID